MANIQGEDHRLLAAVVDIRLSTVEEKVDGLAGKVDSLSDSVHEVIGKLSSTDTKASAQSKVAPTTVVGLLSVHPWLLPVMLVLGSLLFGSTAFLNYLNR